MSIEGSSASEDRFGAAVEAYRAYRPPYPPQLFHKIVDELLPPRERAVDLGAGTGLTSLPLCEFFGQVFAVEPSELMAEKLDHLSPLLQVIRLSAEDLPPTPPSPIDLVIAGSSFYWMDGPLVLEKMARWLRPAGRIALFRYGLPGLPEPIEKIIRREMSERWDNFRHPRLRDEGYSIRTLRASPHFEDIQTFTLPNTLKLDPTRLVGFFRSTSYGAAYLSSTPHPGDYLDDLFREISEATGSSTIPVDFTLEILTARRKDT